MVPIILISHSKPLVNSYVRGLLKKLGLSELLVKKIEKDGSGLKIDAIRSIATFLIRATTEIRLVLIYDFETAKSEVQNALLKILEERVGNTQFVIVCKEASNMLPTIVSRAKVVKLFEAKPSRDHIGDDFGFYKYFEKTDKIKADKAIVYADYTIAKMRFEVKDALVRKDMRQISEKLYILKEALNCRLLLMRNNLNPQIAADHLLILSRPFLPA